MKLNNVYNEDNIELLSKINENSINLIYCDVLYNTKSTFKQKDGAIAYVDNIGNVDDVIEFYDSRFKEMYRTLTNDGTIVIQCDYRISPYIQICLDKYFAFQDKIIWKKNETGKGAKSKKVLSKDYDEIFYYTKSNNFTANKFPKPHDSLSLKEFKYFDEEKQKHFKIVQLGMYSKISVEEMRKNGEIYTTKSGKEYKKYYLSDMNEGVLSNIWLDCKNLYNGENKEMVDYPTQKPVALLERIIRMFSNEGDIVADFFCGSGTSMVVAKELDRQYIGCDINPRAVEITHKRLSRV